MTSKMRLFSFFLTFLSIYGFSQEYEKIRILPAGEPKGITQTIMVDINKDGILDVVVTAAEGGIVWYPGIDTEGNFGPRIDVASDTDIISAIIVEDMDGDGYPDIVFSGQYPHKVGWYKNLDGEDFAAMQTIENQAVRDIIVKDVNLDGIPDLVITDSQGVYWFQNVDGLGSFTNRRRIAYGFDGFSLINTDVDGDGHSDLIVSTYGGLKLLKNTGENATYEDLGRIGSLYSNPDDFVTADITGNGLPDIIFAEGDYLRWYENNGDGLSWTEHLISNQMDMVRRLGVADMNNDGKTDIVFKTQRKISWYEYEEDEDENISFNTIHKITDSAGEGTAMTLADVDNDGKIDVINGARSGNFVTWLKNNGPAGFERERFISLNVFAPQEIRLADINGNSTKDIVYIDGNRKIIWLENVNRAQKFIPHFVDVNSKQVRSFVLADFNNDGHIDIAIATEGPEPSAWYENDGNGNFTRHNLHNGNFGGNSEVIAAIDVDGDGKIDIVKNLGTSVIWHQNNGSSFSTPKLIMNDFLMNSIAVADVNDDGRDDLIIGSFHKNTRYLKNNGNGNFSSQVVSDKPTGRYTVLGMKLNDNALTDIIVGNIFYTGPYNYSLTRYKNLGDGSFHDLSLGAETNIHTLISADMNNDGINDLLYINREERKILWKKGTGHGFYTARVLDSSEDDFLTIAAADLDDDSFTDVVAGTSYNNGLFLYKTGEFVGTDDFKLANEIKIYPNPTENIFYVESPANILKISVYDLSGRQILEIHNQDQVDLTSYKSGLYLVKIEDINNQVSTGKLIKN